MPADVNKVLQFLQFFTRVTWGRSPQHRYITIVQTTTTSSVVLYLLPLDLLLLWSRFLFFYLLLFSLLFCYYCLFSFSFCCSTTTSISVLFSFSSRKLNVKNRNVCIAYCKLDTEFPHDTSRRASSWRAGDFSKKVKLAVVVFMLTFSLKLQKNNVEFYTEV